MPRTCPRRRARAAAARDKTAEATARERHAEALAAWIEGELDRALASGRHPAEHPQTSSRSGSPLQLFLARPLGGHAGLARAGAAEWGRSSGLGSVLPAAASPTRSAATTRWPSRRPGPSTRPRRPLGRARVAHVLEMQGRRGEGIAWVAGLERHWEGGNNLIHHLWWHRAMYHLEARDSTRAGSLRPPLPRPGLPGDGGAARPLHRRAERRLHAVSPRAPRRRRRRPLARAGRQGGAAHRRLPVGLHPAALDDGARGDRARRGRARMLEAMRVRRAQADDVAPSSPVRPCR